MSTQEQKSNQITELDGEQHWEEVDELSAILYDEMLEELKEEEE